MQFDYQARTKKGVVQKGVVEASSEEAALQILNEYGLYVTKLSSAEKEPIYAKDIDLFGGPSPRDVMVFSRELSIMFRTRVPVTEALNTLAKQSENKKFRQIIIKIQEAVEAGTALSDAFEKYPDLFSPFYINMLRSGEAAGKASEVMEYLAEHLERQYELTGKIKGAMYYPVFILIVLVVIVFGMIFFVIPNFKEFFAGLDTEPPLITRIVFGVSDFLRGWWPILFGALIGMGAGFYMFYKSELGSRAIGFVSLRLPIVSSMLRLVYIARFAENLSTLIASGVPIAQAIDITARVVGNEHYKKIILSAKEAVQQGASMSSILEGYPEEFEPVFTQMVYIGEQSGTLDSTLSGMVDFYQKEVDRKTASFLSLLEPMMLIVVAILVGGMIASVLLPLYSTLTSSI